MLFRKFAGGLFFGLLALSLNGANTLAVQLSKQDGDRLQRKIDEIAANGSTVPVQSKKTRASENEVNSYLTFNFKNKIPQGLTNPEISIIGDGSLAGRALVDIDEYKRHQPPQGFMDPLSYISGQVPVTARGVLRTRAGKGQFQLASAEMGGVPLPEPMLQQLVAFFSSTPQNPRGFDMNAPFNLPAKIREVVIGKGEAVVVQ